MLTAHVVEAAEVRPKTWTAEEVRTYARSIARTHGLNENHFVATLNDESQGFSDVAIQSQFRDSSGPNGQENSWGVCQINLDSHADITRAEAQDPYFCIPWAAERWQAGDARLWSSWRHMQAKYGDSMWPE